MKRGIVTHVGTSVLSCEALLLHASFDTSRLREDLLAERARQDQLTLCVADLTRGLSDTWSLARNFTLAQRRYESPAEIAALSLLGVRAADTVALVHSDTAAGRFCGNLLSQVLESATIAAVPEYPRCQPGAAPPREVTGLRITDDSVRDQQGSQQDSVSFTQHGIAAYVARVWDVYAVLTPDDELVFNITGGYKGLAPLARDIALLLAAQSSTTGGPRVRMCYLFQTSSDLIWYEPLPMSMQWEALPLEQLAQAGEPAGITPDDVPTTYATLFTAQPGTIDAIGPLQRSASGEVIWTLATLMEDRAAHD